MMRRGWMTLAASAMVLAGAACGRANESAAPPAEASKGPPPLPAPETVSSRPKAGPGERLYLEKCAMCHGPGGMCMKRPPVTTQEVVNALCTGRALEEAVAALLRKRDDDHYARPEFAKKARREEAIPEQWRRPKS